jgi:hypothetical protein
LLSEGVTLKVVDPLIVPEFGVNPEVPASAPKTDWACTVLAADVGKAGPRTSEGRPIVVDVVLTPVT